MQRFFFFFTLSHCVFSYFRLGRPNRHWRRYGDTAAVSRNRDRRITTGKKLYVSIIGYVFVAFIKPATNERIK